MTTKTPAIGDGGGHGTPSATRPMVQAREASNISPEGGVLTDPAKWLAGFLRERDESLGWGGGEDEERASSASIILSCLETLSAAPPISPRGETPYGDAAAKRLAATTAALSLPTGSGEGLAVLERLAADFDALAATRDALCEMKGIGKPERMIPHMRGKSLAYKDAAKRVRAALAALSSEAGS
jgi:hypothetical protein